MTQQQVVDHVFAAMAKKTGGWVITVNLDHLQRFDAKPEVRDLCEGADLIVADGAPLVWASHLQGTPLPERVAGSDLVWLMAERAATEGRSLYLLGGEPGVAEAASEVLQKRSPELRIAGFSSPWVSPEPTENELASVRSEIEAGKPDLVYVALGAPKQERVIAALHSYFPATWWMGVGISLSFVAGAVPRAPGWIQRLGMEWVHRFAQEPRRLARRYLVDDLPFAFRMLARSWSERFRGRCGPSE
jgi:N-acetylglucosaminyldiphosphoundecaprenol N-acetyl-beta-D-mannosaminyltransferase